MWQSYPAAILLQYEYNERKTRKQKAGFARFVTLYHLFHALKLLAFQKQQGRSENLK
jgi:hypothetical protein